MSSYTYCKVDGMNIHDFVNSDISFDTPQKPKPLAINDTTGMTYEEIRQACIESFKYLYRDDLTFDLNFVPKNLRIKLSEDLYYRRYTNAYRAVFYGQQLQQLQDIQNQGFVSADGKDNTRNILSALQQQQELIFRNLTEADDDSKINIAFIALTREEFMQDDKVEVFVGTKTDATLSGGTTATEEDKIKEKAKALLEKEEQEE